MATNKYATACEKCGCEVPAGKGILEKRGGKWVVRHTDADESRLDAERAVRDQDAQRIWSERNAALSRLTEQQCPHGLNNFDRYSDACGLARCAECKKVFVIDFASLTLEGVYEMRDPFLDFSNPGIAAAFERLEGRAEAAKRSGQIESICARVGRQPIGPPRSLIRAGRGASVTAGEVFEFGGQLHVALESATAQRFHADDTFADLPAWQCHFSAVPVEGVVPAPESESQVAWDHPDAIRGS